jgi:hypothetical protein
MTGFMFQHGRPDADGVEDAIHDLLTAVAPAGFKI